MAFLQITLVLLAALNTVAHPAPFPNELTPSPTRPRAVTVHPHALAPPNCFPALGFKMPSAVPTSLTNWWCDPSTEYAWLGFSYEISACQSLSQLTTEFKDIRNTFKGRYVRLYGFCDTPGPPRRALLKILHSNSKAKFVTRALQFGSEPLFDFALEPTTLASEITKAKANLSSLGIPVTISELAYGYQERASLGSQKVLDAIQLIDAHILPFFSQEASIANKSWPLVQSDLNWFLDNGGGKKIYFSQNGWPSVTSDGVQPNSPSAVANVQNEHDYLNVLDSHCSFFKTVPGGGVGWFWHIYSDKQEPGYGLYGTNGKLKFSPFAPKTSC
ncbi:B-(1-6) glucan synthase [Mycena kentingensis (nom. inval.)]|nr:B-(1-6) glucan synthase [Mycena kentingensis (nom. inval.)]